MTIYFNRELARGYRALSQQVRIMTEAWMVENMYCPHCGCEALAHLKNNLPAADLACPQCQIVYELKSTKNAGARKIVNGAYDTLLQRITSARNPDLFVMTYSLKDWCVENLWLIPRHFFVPSVIEKRSPLTSSARRAGWVGSNILFSQIPEQGRVCLLHRREAVQREVVLRNMREADALATDNLTQRGWLMDVLLCMNRIPGSTFTLQELYRFEPWLAQRHPTNRHILPKIRQQLQCLRDRGLLEFQSRGVYQKRSI
ncbi:MAG: DpnI domain-containing protein [Candidatus Spyradenecus sp.]